MPAFFRLNAGSRTWFSALQGDLIQGDRTKVDLTDNVGIDSNKLVWEFFANFRLDNIHVLRFRTEPSSVYNSRGDSFQKIRYFQVGYDNADRDINAVLLYNVFGERIVDVGVNGAPDIYEQPRPSLDFIYSQGFGQWKLKAKLKNILDPQIELTQGAETTQSTRIGRELSIAVEYEF